MAFYVAWYFHYYLFCRTFLRQNPKFADVSETLGAHIFSFVLSINIIQLFRILKTVVAKNITLSFNNEVYLWFFIFIMFMIVNYVLFSYKMIQRKHEKTLRKNKLGFVPVIVFIWSIYSIYWFLYNFI